MPLYDYKCRVCDRIQEVKKQFGDTSPEKCGRCENEMTRQFSVPAIQFKGSGFYSTDNRK